MENEAEHIFAVPAAWTSSHRGGGVPTPSLSSLLRWKRMGRIVHPAGPQLQSKAELKCCFVSVLSGWDMLTLSVQLHFHTWCGLC